MDRSSSTGTGMEMTLTPMWQHSTTTPSPARRPMVWLQARHRAAPSGLSITQRQNWVKHSSRSGPCQLPDWSIKEMVCPVTLVKARSI